jgi:hypothetical protein
MGDNQSLIKILKLIFSLTKYSKKRLITIIIASWTYDHAWIVKIVAPRIIM